MGEIRNKAMAILEIVSVSVTKWNPRGREWGKKGGRGQEWR